MPGPLKVYKQQLIKELKEQGKSNRAIAKLVGVGRNTVNNYVQRLVPLSDNPPTGSEAENELFVPNLPAGSEVSSGPDSACEPYRSFIEDRIRIGLSAQRIYQDLVSEKGFSNAYDSVKRFVRRLKGDSSTTPFRRMEVLPGEEAQVDYGQGPWIVQPDGKRRRSHVFRIVLSHSRKGYSELSFYQTTEAFIRSMENSFIEFGGVPQTLVIDNLKAAVSHPDWYDPELTKKVADFASHYGTTILPTKPYMPRHKGKIERGVDYVKENALKGRIFNSLDSANRFLRHWERNVADTRIHGTTREQVRLAYERERSHLLPLPDGLFPSFEEATRRVAMDGHVQVANRNLLSLTPGQQGCYAT
jgi:transposase